MFKRVTEFVPWLTAVVAVSLVLGGCAQFGGGLVPGQARYEDVAHRFGQPAMQWREADGSQRLAYPQGPQGLTTYIAVIAPDGTLRSIENVLDEQHFADVVVGRSDRDDILRRFGPPREVLEWDRRDEQTWEWRYRDQWLQLARFVVVFDRKTWTVKQTMQLREVLGRDHFSDM